MAEHVDTHDGQETTGTPGETNNPAIALEAAAKDGNTSEVLSLLQKHSNEPDTEPTFKTLKALALRYAAESGHTELVAELLKLGVDAETRETVLRLAARNGHAGVTKALLKYQRTLSVWPYLYRKGKWMTGFLDAVAFGHVATVKVMLGAGMSANLKYQCAVCISNTQTRCGICRSETAIWLAAHNGRGEIVELLLAHGANPRAEPKTGGTALHRAAERGDEQMVLNLLRAGWDPNRMNNERRTPALYAAWKGHRGVFDSLLKNGAKIGDIEAVWVSYWIHTKNSNALKMVLGPLEPASFSKQNIISPSPRRAASWPVLHPLRKAIETGDVAVTRCLLEYNKRHSVFADSDYLDGFRSATESSNEALLELLVEYWPWTDKRTREQHVYAAVKHKAAHGHRKSVLMLIEWHYEFGRCPTLLATALFTAVYYTQMATVRALIATAGADVNTHIPQRTLEVLGQVRRGWDGDCPLHIAARHGNKEMCAILLEHGADLAARGYNDYTPLHVAAARDYSPATGILQLLLDRGADLEATTGYGKTPIHVARGVKNIVCLHKAGANLDHQDSYGKTALHRAASVGNMEEYKSLVELGADDSLRDKDGVSARECYEAKLEEMRNKKKCTCSRSRMRTLCSCNL